MDGFERLSKSEYQRLAARWRRLAADATTRQTKTRLLTLARQCEFLALGVAQIGDKPEELGLLDTPQ
jgi:hypothetical protein